MPPPLRRYLADRIRADLAQKMVFVAGPRQVGKTTLARGLLPDPAGYLNWDVPNLSAIERLAVRLTDLVGAPLSVNALREDLQVSHGAVARWLDVLERLYAIVRVPPFGAPAIRAVKKAQKHYHYDWIQVRDAGARFENLVAMHLLKWVHHEQDVRGRDPDQRRRLGRLPDPGRRPGAAGAPVPPRPDLSARFPSASSRRRRGRFPRPVLRSTGPQGRRWRHAQPPAHRTTKEEHCSRR